MSQNFIADIEEFTREMVKHSKEQVIHTVPTLPSSDVRKLRYDLIFEEVNETLKAILRMDSVELADGIADSIVVLIGTALAYGIPLQKVWDEVHRSNMDKVTRVCLNCVGDGGVHIKGLPCELCHGTCRIPITPKVRADGKILKPEGWQPPNIADIIQMELQPIKLANDDRRANERFIQSGPIT